MRRGGGFRGVSRSISRPHRFASSSRRISRGASSRISGRSSSFGGGFGGGMHNRRSGFGGSSYRPSSNIHHRPRHNSFWFGPRRRYYGPFYRRRRYYGNYGYYEPNPIASIIGLFIFLFFFVIIFSAIIGSSSIPMIIAVIIFVIAIINISNQSNNQRTSGSTTPNVPSGPAPLTSTPQYVQRPNPVFCNACGAATLKNQLYCSTCGTKLT